MKKIVKSIMLIAAAAMTFTACEKEYDAAIVNPEIKLTIVAGNPAACDAETRTSLNGMTPMWSPSDAIGVATAVTSADSKVTWAQKQFTNDSSTESETTTFSGTISEDGAEMIYTYYPYTANGLTATGAAKVDLPANQTPTATSFDGSADLLVGRPVKLDITGSQKIEGVEFKRLTGVLKVVLNDKTTDSKLSGQNLSTLSLTADKDLAGRVYVNLETTDLGSIYYNNSKTVTANYTSATQFELDGENATYLSVYPATLEAGTTLTLEAETETIAIAKEISLSEDIVIEAGKITTLNIAIEDEHVSASESGLELPFTDDLSWASDGQSGDNSAALAVSAYPENQYSETAYTYKSENGIKFGSASNRGYFVTADLNLSEDFTVIVQAKDYGSDGSKLKVTAGEKVADEVALTSELKYYTFKFDAQDAKSKVRVDITGKRGYVRYFSVIKGHDTSALPVKLSITSGDKLEVEAEGENAKITYEIENPRDGEKISASSSETWIHDFNYDTDNEVSFTVDVNDGDAREATITFTYADATAQTVTVKQGKVGVLEDKEIEFSFTSNPGGWPTSSSAGSYNYVKDGTTYTFTTTINCFFNSKYLFFKIKDNTSVLVSLGLPAIEGYRLASVKATHPSSGASTSAQLAVTTAASSSTAVSGGAAIRPTGGNYEFTLS